MLRPYPLQQQTVDATGEFDPVGTLVVFVILLLSVYGVRVGWLHYQAQTGVRAYAWLVLVIIGAFIATIMAISLLLNIAAALGLT